MMASDTVREDPLGGSTKNEYLSSRGKVMVALTDGNGIIQE
jgi:hypothetical protein